MPFLPEMMRAPTTLNSGVPVGSAHDHYSQGRAGHVALGPQSTRTVQPLRVAARGAMPSS